MTYRLFDAILDLAKILGEVYEGAATTTGSTTSLTDSRLDYSAGELVGGTLWAPVPMQSRYISSSLATVVTFDAISTAVANGGAYAVTTKRWPRYLLIQSVNAALQEMGGVRTETTFAAVADQQEYDGGTYAAVLNTILEVYHTERTAEPYNWIASHNWQQMEDGTGRKLIFDPGYEMVAGETIRVITLAQHTVLDSDDDEIMAQVEPEALKWAAAVHALRWRKQRTRADEGPMIDQMMEEARAMSTLMKSRYPLSYQKQVRLSQW